MNRKLLEILICLKCKTRLDFIEGRLVCSRCGKVYSIQEGIPYFIEIHDLKPATSGDLMFKIKLIFKRYPAVFDILSYLFGALFVGKSVKKFTEHMSEQGIILNLGSGTKLIRKDVINVDFYPFPNVNLIANISNLPFADNSVDAIICEWVLEHIKNPEMIIKEMKRILRPGGKIYVSVPFMEGFHSSPGDYHRWSKQGVKELLKDFKEIEIGEKSGPTSAFVSVFTEWLATLFSFNLMWLYQVLLILLMIITFPLKFLDYLISRFSSSQNIAFGFYFIGEKK